MKKSDCLLYIYTHEAYTFKVLAELLQNCIIEAWFGQEFDSPHLHKVSNILYILYNYV